VDKNGLKTLQREAAWSKRRVEIGESKRKSRSTPVPAARAGRAVQAAIPPCKYLSRVERKTPSPATTEHAQRLLPALNIVVQEMVRNVFFSGSRASITKSNLRRLVLAIQPPILSSWWELRAEKLSAQQGVGLDNEFE